MKSSINRFVTAVVASIVLSGASLSHADEVTNWSEILETTAAGTPHFLQSRSAAIMHLAMFDAINAIVGDYQPYLGTIAAPPWASPEAAAVAAAHWSLVALYPGSAADLDAERALSLAAIPDGPAKEAGIAVGELAAEAMLTLRANDGSNVIVPYVPILLPGLWRPTPPELQAAAFVGWGRVTRFAIDHSGRFRLNPPPPINSGKYAQDYNEVKALGGVDDALRPPDRADVARYYAATLPMPLWPTAARQVAEVQDKSLIENARDFAWLAMALCDSLIASMEMKFHHNLWRPVSAIREGATDRNRFTDPDPSWLSFVFTPPYPAYPGNHASAAGAARAVLEHAYGSDGLDITLTTPTLPGVVLNYTSWEQIIDDIDDARIYGGVHFRFDQEAGARLGRQVGSHIFRSSLRPARGR